MNVSKLPPHINYWITSTNIYGRTIRLQTYESIQTTGVGVHCTRHSHREGALQCRLLLAVNCPRTSLHQKQSQSWGPNPRERTKCLSPLSPPALSTLGCKPLPTVLDSSTGRQVDSGPVVMTFGKVTNLSTFILEIQICFKRPKKVFELQAS